jgi:hypothetical protein
VNRTGSGIPSDAPMVVNSFFESLAPRAISGSFARARRRRRRAVSADLEAAMKASRLSYLTAVSGETSQVGTAMLNTCR